MQDQETEYYTTLTEGQILRVQLRGNWVLMNVSALENVLDKLSFDTEQQLVFECGGLQNLDTSGAWLLYRAAKKFEEKSISTDFRGFKADHFKFITNVSQVFAVQKQRLNHDFSVDSWRRLLSGFEQLILSIKTDLIFLGKLLEAIFQVLRHPKLIRKAAIVTQLYETCVKGLPIVIVMGFMISLVLAYQGASQLDRFGAQIYTIDLVAVSVLREMGGLLTAIMIAGRSGSAFTAQIGVMKLNEETDAMKTIGMDPMMVLVIPRVFALMLGLPVLVFVADLVGLLGAGVISVTLLELPVSLFMERLHAVVSWDHFWVGMVKAPVFAFIIAYIGTMRGMNVSSSAESVGKSTTRSVVESIFLVIVVDALFSILFSILEI